MIGALYRRVLIIITLYSFKLKDYRSSFYKRSILLYIVCNIIYYIERKHRINAKQRELYDYLHNCAHIGDIVLFNMLLSDFSSH